MTRRFWWITGLVGIGLKAQNKDGSIVKTTSNCMYDKSGRLVNPGCQNVSEENGVKTYSPGPERINPTKRPANGECPVCHEMAPKYDRKEAAVAMNATGPCTGTRGPLTVCLDSTPDNMPFSRRIDCEHCGNTFRQFAEDVKR